MARTGRRGTNSGRARSGVTPTPTGQPPGALWYRPRHAPRKGKPPKRKGPGRDGQRVRGPMRLVPRPLRRFFRRKYWWLWLFVIAPCVMILGLMATLVVAYESINI